MTQPQQPANLQQLRESGWQTKTVKQEIRDNFLRMLAGDEELFPGIIGFESTVIPEINIANAIEEFLQYKLLTSSQFPRRNIHVRAAPYGGLRIDVDDKSYEAVGDVEDSEVRAFLQTTIEEWQDRQ